MYAPNEVKERRVFFEGLGGMCVENCLVVGGNRKRPSGRKEREDKGKKSAN